MVYCIKCADIDKKLLIHSSILTTCVFIMFGMFYPKLSNFIFSSCVLLASVILLVLCIRGMLDKWNQCQPLIPHEPIIEQKDKKLIDYIISNFRVNNVQYVASEYDHQLSLD